MTERAPDAAGVHILIQNGEYWMINKGDLAMMDVTVRQLRERLPAARVGVATSAPLLLRAYLPDAEPVLVKHGSNRVLTATVRRLPVLPPRLAGPVAIGALSADHRRRGLVRRLGRHLHRPAWTARAASARRSGGIERAVAGTTLVLAMGGGYLTDVDVEQTRRTFDLLDEAVSRGIPTAMVGQGIGPLEDADLLARAARVLPQVDLIALREGVRGPQLLDRLGVPADRVLVTGDDAIELAYAARRPTIGEDIGICLRVAHYSPVGSATMQAVGAAVRAAAGGRRATLRPLIVSEYLSEDRRSTLPLVDGFPRVRPAMGRYDTAHALAEAVAQCRVMVTGAYHLAVFALSQGIPVIGLSSSAYYDDKLLGLRDMFGGGLTPQRLDAPDLGHRLEDAVTSAWDEAPEIRERLRARAKVQIAASTAAFDRVAALARRPGPVAANGVGRPGRPE